MKPGHILWMILCVCFLSANNVFSENGSAEEPCPPLVSRIILEIEDVSGDKTALTEMARNLIFLREGSRFSSEQLEASIDALKLCKKFQDIRIDSSDGEKEMTITFRMKPFRLIKDIEINDASPLFEREILNAMTIYIGDVFVKEELAKQETLIGKIFQDEGFVNPEVSLKAQEDPKDGHFMVFVNIDRGKYYSVRRLDFQGNKSFLTQRLKLRTKTWMASLLPRGPGRFIEKNLRQDIKDLIEYYRKKQYPDVMIDSKIEKDPETHSVFITLTIDEGMRYDVNFQGNEAFWDLTLKKDLAIFKHGNKNNLGIRKSVRSIKDRYGKAGYLEAEVTVEDEIKADKAVRRLCFVINEGPQSIVESIRITGNHLFDKEKIKKQMLTQLPGTLAKGAYIPEVLEDDLNAIQSLYLRHGHMKTQITKEVKLSNDKQRVSIDIRIEEGVRTLVSRVKVSGSKILSEEEASQTVQVKKGEPFREEMVQEDEKRLASVVSEKGHPHVTVKGEVSVSEDQTAAQVEYKVSQGPYVEMGEVYFTGNFRTKKRILLNELEIEPNAPFSLVKLLETQRNFRDMNIFDSVQFKAIGLKEKADKVHLFVETEEEKPYFVEVGVGYDTERTSYAHARSGDRNLFGTNKSAWLGGEVSEIGYRGEFGVTEPRLFSSKVSMTFGIFIEEEEQLNQDFGIRVFGSSLGFARKLSKHLSVGLNFGFEQRNQFRHGTGEDIICDVRDEECETRRNLVSTPSVTYDTRDSFVRPKSGMFSSASVAVSQGLENSVDNFLKYQLDARFYWSPAERLTFAWHGRAGHIHLLGSEKAADDQLFFLGGTSDVRGFKENLFRSDTSGDPLGGHTALLGSVEARIDLGLNFELTTFYDMGTLRDTFNESDSKRFRSSVGVGLRYITPIGPIGFLYGLKLGREKGESAGRLHFALGYTF